MRLGFFLLFLAVNAYQTYGQVTGNVRPLEFVEAPREIILQVIAVQPDCPIRFENVRYLVGTDGGESNSYELRNISQRPIRSVTVASSSGAVNTYAKESGILANPGALILKPSNDPSLCKSCRQPTIIPLTADLRIKLGLTPPMRSIITLMVLEVHFSDGTKYSDEKAYKELQEYLDKLDDAFRQSGKPGSRLRSSLPNVSRRDLSVGRFAMRIS